MMPSSGLSLIGFEAHHPHVQRYLRNSCICADESEAGLKAEWEIARGRLGEAFPGAGRPAIRAVPAACQPHVSRLVETPWLSKMLAGPWAGATFQMVEIDPLLSFQVTIEIGRSQQIFAETGDAADLGELAGICLPVAPKAGQVQYICQQNSILIRSRLLDLSSFSQGISENFAGVRFGFSPSLVHVVRYRGRCYLHNGFHRAYGARLAGATEIPCLFREVANAESVGFKPDGATLGLELMESGNPPTLAHYTRGRAHPVQLRALSRVIHVSWSEYTIPEE